MNLFQATELARLERYVDHDTGEIDLDSFNRSLITLQDKQRAVVAYVKNTASDIKQIDDAIKELLERKGRMVNRNEALTDYLKVNMKHSHTNEITAENSTFSAKLYLDRDVSVQWVEGVQIPDAFATVKEVKTYSKTLAREAIERGEPVACAVIVRKDRLTISGDKESRASS